MTAFVCSAFNRTLTQLIIFSLYLPHRNSSGWPHWFVCWNVLNHSKQYAERKELNEWIHICRIYFLRKLANDTHIIHWAERVYYSEFCHMVNFRWQAHLISRKWSETQTRLFPSGIKMSFYSESTHTQRPQRKKSTQNPINENVPVEWAPRFWDTFTKKSVCVQPMCCVHWFNLLRTVHRFAPVCIWFNN